MQCQSFLEKNKKTMISLSSAEFAHRVVKINVSDTKQTNLYNYVLTSKKSTLSLLGKTCNRQHYKTFLSFFFQKIGFDISCKSP